MNTACGNLLLIQFQAFSGIGIVLVNFLSSHIAISMSPIYTKQNAKQSISVIAAIFVFTPGMYIIDQQKWQDVTGFLSFHGIAIQIFISIFTELRLLLLGWKGVGKSSVGNSILGRRFFESGQETELCLRRQALVCGRRVTIVDTPGWDWFSVRRTPKRIRQESQRGAALLRPGPHTLLLVLPVVSSLTARKRRTLLAHIETLFGDSACLHTMVLFSCGDWLGCTPIEEHILRGGRELQRLLEYCGNYYHVLDSKTPGKDKSVSVLLDKIEEMIRENGDKAFLPIQTEWCKLQFCSPVYFLLF